MNPELQEQINTFRSNASDSDLDVRILGIITSYEQNGVTEIEETTLSTIFSLYKLKNIEAVNIQLVSLITQLGLQDLKAIAGVDAQTTINAPIFTPSTDVSKIVIPEENTPYEPQDRPADLGILNPDVIPEIDETEYQDPKIVLPTEQNQEILLEGLAVNIRETVFLDSLSSPVSERFLGLFSQEYAEKISSSNSDYVSNESGDGINSFLLEVVDSVVGKLTPEERGLLKDMYFHINVSYRDPGNTRVKKIPLRIYLEPFIQPREIQPETDNLSRSLQDGTGILDEQLRGFLFDMIVERLFLGEISIDFYGQELDILEQKQAILKNLEVLVSFIMHIESNFEESSNTRSSAKGKMQYLNGERNGIVNIGHYTSEATTPFQTGLNRTNQLFDSLDLENNPYREFFSLAHQKSLESYLYSPLELTTEQEIILFFADTLQQARNTGGDTTNLGRLLRDTLILGESAAMRVIYEDYHHRDPDTPTERRIQQMMGIYSPRLSPAVSEDFREEFGLRRKIELLSFHSLQQGSRNENVRFLQTALMLLGENVGELQFGEETLYYGNNTTHAVLSFQLRNGVIDSPRSSGAGIFGPRTRSQLIGKLQEVVDSIMLGTHEAYTSEDLFAIVSGVYNGEQKSLDPLFSDQVSEQEKNQDIDYLNRIFNSEVNTGNRQQMQVVQRVLVFLGYPPFKNNDPSSPYEIDEVKGVYGTATFGAIERFLDAKNLGALALPSPRTSGILPTEFLSILYEDLEKYIATVSDDDIGKLTQDLVNESSSLYPDIYPDISSSISEIEQNRLKGQRVDILQDSLPSLLLDDRGAEVAVLHVLLESLEGDYGEISDDEKNSNFYGQSTQDFIRNFQLQHGIIQDENGSGVGVFGPQTKKAVFDNITNKAEVYDALLQISLFYREAEVVETDYNVRLDISEVSFQNIPSDIGFGPRHIRNYSRRVLPYYEFARRVGTIAPWVSNDAEARRLVETGDLMMIPRELNTLRASSSEVKDEYLRLTPDAYQVMQYIGYEFHRRVQDVYGITDGWSMRLSTNSLLRPAHYNARLRNSSEQSAHIRGIGFDVAHVRFNLVNESTNERIVIPTRGRTGQDLVHIGKNILFELLVELDNAGVIIFTKEGSHPHITVIQSIQGISTFE